MVNPVNGEVLKEVPTFTAEQVVASIDKADAVAKQWAVSGSWGERAAALRRVGELHFERREELAQLLVKEVGKPIGAARDEMGYAKEIYDYYADNAETLLADEPIALQPGEDPAFVRRSALGVLLGVMPWNYPYYQTARFVAPNILLGNTTLIKLASQCPDSAAAIEQLFHDAGFPVGAYVNIFASNGQVADAIADPRVHGVTLTGSERAGAAVGEAAGRHLKKAVLELGGNDPYIVLQTDDMDKVVEHAVHKRLEFAGQACNGAKRFIIVDDLYDDFLEKFTVALTAVRPSDPALEDTELGPLASLSAAEELEDQVKRAVAAGATLHAGGERNGSFFEPTILTDIRPGDAAAKEEFFGPVAQVYRVVDEDEAVRLANDTPFGLGSYLISDDAEQVKRVSNQIQAGMVFVKFVGAGGPGLPFGGIKRSGFGRELGSYGLDEFANKKLIRVPA